MLKGNELKFHQLSLIKNALESTKSNGNEEAYHLLRLFQLTGDERFKLQAEPLMPQLSKTTKQLPESRVESTIVNPQTLPLRLEDFRLSEKPNIRFCDVGGLADVKEAIKLEMVYPKLRPNVYIQYNKTPGAGILFWGPPGCGKTMMAKAVATEIDALFVAPKMSDIMSRWLGESEKMISSLFKAAGKYEGDIVLFFDEFDSLAPKSGPSYLNRIKNQFLTEIDGIGSKRKGMLIMAATNKPFHIDSAARRPGRFEKTIFIPPPDLTSRKQIFELNLSPLIKNGILNDDVVISDLAEITEGYSGADIKAINDTSRDIALSEALKNGIERKVKMDDFYNVIKKTPRSIIPWINDSIRAAKRFGEEDYYPELQKVAQLLQTVQQYESMK